MRNLRELGDRVITLGSGILLLDYWSSLLYELILGNFELSSKTIFFKFVDEWSFVSKYSDYDKAQANEAPAIPPPTIRTSVSCKFWLSASEYKCGMVDDLKVDENNL